ncbi:MAG TPA: DUF2171 domain-containing protein [Solirubrobacteraceae bacterium]|jgi:hypothetical protein|nr:DUF2171 domain-containing protein [Solirubrobacteraceae bacterium]
MSVPVSWKSIKPGWKVLAADGSKVGEVDEVTGDERSDIFDGISIAVNKLGQPRYATSDLVAGVEQGIVRLSLDREHAAQLGQYLQPASSEAIEPDDHGGTMERIKAKIRQIEGDIVEPTQRHEHPFNFWTRLAHLVHRLRGR